MNADQSKYYEDQIAQLLKERDDLLNQCDATRRELVSHREKARGNYWGWLDDEASNYLETLSAPVLIPAADLKKIIRERDDLARRCDFAKDPEMAHDDELGWMHKDSLDEVNALRAKVAEMRDVLDAIWDRDELSATRDPEDESGCSVCPECEAHLPHGGHSTDCITGKIDHAKSGDCGRGYVPVSELDETLTVLQHLRNYICANPTSLSKPFADMAIAELARLQALKEGK